jgi:hypothetical protein
VGISSLRSKALGVLLWVAPLLFSLLILSPVAASGESSTCVVKFKFSSDDKSDSATDAYVQQVLTAQGYKIVDDWLFTMLRSSDYDVKITITHTVDANFGFPVTSMWIQLLITDSSGTAVVNDYVDRANLADDLRASIPACSTSPLLTGSPGSDAQYDERSSAQPTTQPTQQH